VWGRVLWMRWWWRVALAVLAVPLLCSCVKGEAGVTWRPAAAGAAEHALALSQGCHGATRTQTRLLARRGSCGLSGLNERCGQCPGAKLAPTNSVARPPPLPLPWFPERAHSRHPAHPASAAAQRSWWTSGWRPLCTLAFDRKRGGAHVLVSREGNTLSDEDRVSEKAAS